MSHAGLLMRVFHVDRRAWSYGRRPRGAGQGLQGKPGRQAVGVAALGLANPQQSHAIQSGNVISGEMNLGWQALASQSSGPRNFPSSRPRPPQRPEMIGREVGPHDPSHLHDPGSGGLRGFMVYGVAYR